MHKNSSLRCAEDRNPPQNATGHMQCIAGPVFASAVLTDKKQQQQKKKKKTNKKTHPSIGYSSFKDHRSVPSFGPGFFCLNSGLRKVQWTCLLCSSLCTYFRDNAVTSDIPLISLVLKSMVPPWYLVYTPGTSGIYFVRLP